MWGSCRRELASPLALIKVLHGASHQIGWTGLVARMIERYGRLEPTPNLAAGKRGAFVGAEEPR